jgi:hypothetical protein
MFELFLNPANMVIGGALISSPIIIHLINRMRFRRVRWAAMEFLLKSQKRNRRRLIIEQLILLFLRILLVILAALLVARFLGAAGIFKARNTLHVVMLDDRLSMGDHWKNEDGSRRTAFDIAKQLIQKEIAQKALAARSAQRLVLRRLSNPTENLFDARLNEESLKDLATTLVRLDEPSYRHLDFADGINAAKEVFNQKEAADDEHILHLVSDFRQRQWSEPEARKINESLASLKAVAIRLVDCAHPFRSEGQKNPLYHDNLAIVDLRPETRIAAEGMPVQFSVRVANYSPAERKNVRVTIKVDGTERPEASLTMMSVPPGAPTEQTFQVAFVRPSGQKAGQPYFAVVTANLEKEEAGLSADNIRYAAMEVRRQVPVLLVDGEPSAGEKPGGDSYHLRALFSAARGFDVIRGSTADLERPNLEQYPSIYLLNVPEMSEKARKNLAGYVRQGGSVAFFMGERVKPEFYNKYLYAEGNGLFPAPLAERPSPALTDEQKQQKVLQNLVEPRMQIYIRDGKHPIFAEVYKYRAAFEYLSIDRYYPVPRQKWNAKARAEHHVEELATLPNERPLSDYEAEAATLADALPIADARYEHYRPALDRSRRAIREAIATGKGLYVLANALEGLLHDRGLANDPEHPNLVDFWQSPDPRIAELRAQVDQFRERVQMGDPLVIAGRYGAGRTVVFLTTAGQKWNDWAGGTGALTYPVVMLEMQKYLTSQEGEADRAVGGRLEFALDASRYEQRMRRELLRSAPDAAGAAAQAPPAGQRAGLTSLGEQSGSESSGQVLFNFDEARTPGVYLFEFQQRPEPGGGEPRRETRAYAFNVDTANESDLKRAGTVELRRVATGATVHHPNGPPIVEPNRQTDLSESPWLYLVFLLVLIAEQALAVHLSFHLAGAQAPLPPQALRPATAA